MKISEEERASGRQVVNVTRFGFRSGSPFNPTTQQISFSYIDVVFTIITLTSYGIKQHDTVDLFIKGNAQKQEKK